MRRLIVLLFISFCLLSISFGTVKALTLEEVRSQFLFYVNSYRKDRGINKLEQLYSYVAQEHAENQATRDKYLAHSGFNTRADHIMNQIKSEAMSEGSSFGFVQVAENCCYFPVCPDPAKKAFELFMASSDHRRNLLKRYQHTAIGIAQGVSGRFYFCQIFF